MTPRVGFGGWAMHNRETMRGGGGRERGRFGQYGGCGGRNVRFLGKPDAQLLGRGPSPPLCGCRVVVELFPDAAPLAVHNFLRLCSSGLGGAAHGGASPCHPVVGACGKPLSYGGCRVHRVQTGFVLQGGDMVFGNGSGGESVFGKKFKDEKVPAPCALFFLFFSCGPGGLSNERLSQ